MTSINASELVFNVREIYILALHEHCQILKFEKFRKLTLILASLLVYKLYLKIKVYFYYDFIFRKHGGFISIWFLIFLLNYFFLLQSKKQNRK